MSQRPRLHAAFYVSAYYAVLILVGLLAAFLGPSLPSLALASSSSLSQISFLLSTRPLGYVLGTLLAGRLLDHRPGHPLMLMALLGAGICLALSAFSQSLFFLCVLMLGIGLADGVLDVSSNTLLPWVLGPRSGPFFNGLHFCFGVGALSAPLLVAEALSWNQSLKAAFLSMALLALLLALGMAFLPSPRREGHEHETHAKLRPLPKSLLALICLSFFCYGGSETALGAWIYSYSLELHLASPKEAAELSSLFWGTLTLGRLLAIPLALRWPLARLLRIDAAGSVLSLLLLLIFPHSESALWLGIAGAGLFMASFFPSLLGHCAQRLGFQGQLSGAMTSLFFISSSTGAILLPWLIGQGFESLGAWLAPASVALALFGMNFLLDGILRLTTVSKA